MIEIRRFHKLMALPPAGRHVHEAEGTLQYREVIQRTGPIRYDEFNRAIPYTATVTAWIDVPDVYESENDTPPVNKDIYQLEAALQELVTLKNIKDRDGKTDDYLARQPEAWEVARKLIEVESQEGE